MEIGIFGEVASGLMWDVDRKPDEVGHRECCQSRCAPFARPEVISLEGGAQDLEPPQRNKRALRQEPKRIWFSCISVCRRRLRSLPSVEKSAVLVYISKGIMTRVRVRDTVNGHHTSSLIYGGGGG